jgi:hypothetical protein
VQLCQVAQPEEWEAVLAVHEDVIQHVRTGQLVDLFPRSVRGKEFSGRIAQISKTDANVTPAHFARDAARTAPTPQQSGDLTTMQLATYQASLPLQAAPGALFAGGTGRAKLHAGHRCLAMRMWDYLARTFHVGL